MNDIRTILKVAAGRLHFNAYLGWLHIVAATIAATALLAVLVSKTSAAINVPWTVVAPGLLAAALLIAFFLWSRRRASELQVALAVDERLDLREKLSTALLLKGREDAFAKAAVDDAVSVARDARTREQVNRRFPIDPPRQWWVTPMLLALAVLAAAFLPQGNWFADDDGTAGASAARAPEEVSMALESTVLKLKANEELADELKDLFQELDPNAFDPSALRTPENARREAIKKLSDLNDRLNEITEGEKGKTVEALQQAMKDLQSPSESGMTKELTEAMASGNFEAAKQKLDELLAKADTGELSAEQQQQLAQDLQALGEQLDQLAQQQQAMKDALAKAGIDPNLASNPQQLQQALQNNQNLSQQQKQQLQQMAQSQQQAMQMCQNMGQAMKQMGQCMGNGQGQGLSQAAGQMGQSLSQAEAMAQMLKQARAMANDLAGQCQGLGKGLGQQAGSGRGGAFGGPGQGAGGEAPMTKTVTSTKETKADNQNPDANIIARTLFEGPLIKGESQAAFREVARSAAESYADEVNDDQIPQKYHDAVKRYFGQLKEKAGVVDEAGDAADEADGEGETSGD